jgi:putative redox protein
MAQHEIETQWMGKMQFNALVNGHTIIMDAPERVGGEDNGPIPKPLVLTALSGCSGMDIVSYLRRTGKEIEDLNIKVTGELSKVAPIEYIAIHAVYSMTGQKGNENAVVEAVNISQEKNCGVANMLRKALPVTWEINYNGMQVYNNLDKALFA